MQHTDKALAELLRLLEANSPEAMGWLLDVGYRQAYINGIAALAVAVLLMGVVIFGIWCLRYAPTVDKGDKYSSPQDGWYVTGALAIILGSTFMVVSAYFAMQRLYNPGYFVYQMLKDLLPGQ